MAEPISIQQLTDASLDVKSLEEVVNGDENVVVTTRLGETYPSVKGSIKKVFDTGGLPATPFATKALMTASVLIDGKYAMVTDDTVNNGLYVKTAGAWVKSAYDPLTQAKSYTDTNKTDTNTKLTGLINADGALIQSDFVLKGFASAGDIAPVSPLQGDGYVALNTGDIFGIKVTKGQYLIRNSTRWRVGDKSEIVRRYTNDDEDTEIVICTRASFGFKGLLTLTGTVTVTNNYDYTGFIPVIAGDEIGAVTGYSPSTSAISFYDADFVFLSGLRDSELPSIVPTQARYMRLCTAFAAEPNPYAYVKRSRTTNTLSKDDLELASSANLANTENIVLDKFIADNLVINDGVGWVMFKIPAAANSTYSFGNFDINENGYAGFFDTNGALVGSKVKFTAAQLPLTVTAPNVDCFLYIDVARPTNTAADYANTMINIGNTLLPYESPYRVVAISGYDLSGSADIDLTPYVKHGSDVSFGEITADSISTSVLALNLPTSDVGLDINQAWIDLATSTIKVKLS